MGIAVDVQDERTELSLEGAIDITSAGALKAELLKAIECGKAVGVSLAAATYLDVTAMQLLWAAERLARQSGVPFEFADKIPETLSRQLAEAGFTGFQSSSLSQPDNIL